MPLEDHRLLGGDGSAALLEPDGTVAWWCTPRPDAAPVLWRLLDDRGGASRWLGATDQHPIGRPAGRCARTVLTVEGRRVACWDGLVRRDGEPTLVRLVRAVDAPVTVTHELVAAAFDTEDGPSDQLLRIHHEDGRSRDGGPGTVHTTFTATPDRWTGLALCRASVAPPPAAPADLVAALERAEEQTTQGLGGSGVVSAHRDRVEVALLVLDACTEPRTGAVIAAPTTSVPEVLGADRQFDYRYAWVRDASLAAAVAALVGQSDKTDAHVGWLLDRCLACEGIPVPVTDVLGEPVPDERPVPHLRSIAGSRPVRVGNAAKDQVQLDGAGFIAEAVWALTTRGGGVHRAAYGAVAALADRAAALEPRPTSGLWEQRQPACVANADVGLWLLFDRALRLQVVYEPWAAGRRRRWRAALERARGRVFEDLLPGGGLPLVHGGTDPDASGLLLVVLGLLSRRDPKAHRLVDATIDALGVGDPVVALRRYPPTVDVGFEGEEPAFVPASWWAVSALARLDRAEQAHAMADRLCQATPGLQPEMLDPLGAGGLGNTPLVWSHAECARALYLLRVADLRARWGGPATGLWETGRAARQAARRVRSMSGRTEVAQNSRNPA